ncbi:hypothetical protein U9M48_003294 [Paspalum notatum var. saurae]|uniref:Uncharacterized protein n=1 Tax=Paspalum notatum var. saurae TaxID=547442 RepID=A0AAQ3PIV0_PASNO
MALGEETPLSDQEHLGEASFVLKVLKTLEENIQKEQVRSTPVTKSFCLSTAQGKVSKKMHHRSADQGGWSPDPMAWSADPTQGRPTKARLSLTQPGRPTRGAGRPTQ